MDGAVKNSDTGLKSFFAFLADKPDALKEKLTELAGQKSLTIPLTIPSPKLGIQNYAVPDDVWVAAIAYKGKAAVDSLVFSKKNFDAAAVDSIAALANL
jgi:hypothetical protein